MINELSETIHENNKNKGFYEGPKNIGEMLALIHSEVSEALEADRRGSFANLESFEDSRKLYRDNGLPNPFKSAFESHIKDTFEDELADIMIRVMDLAAYKRIDLERHIKAKISYNVLRPYKHNKNY